MQRWDRLEDVPPDLGATVVSIGVFDGVHRGHQYLVGRAVEQARARGVPVVATTFDPHPTAVLRPDRAPALLAPVERRVELLGRCGADAVLVLPFTLELSTWSPERFVREVLADVLHAASVVVGTDFRFGARAAGDTSVLAQLGERYGFTVDPVALVGDERGRVSSSAVREAVAAGEVETAAALLGRAYRLEGVVVPGDRRGRTLGYPTANLEPPPGRAVPGDGVYAGWLHHGDRQLPAAVSIGTNPTFDGPQRRVEAYVLDRDDLSLYGEPVAVEFLTRLRPTLRFEQVEDLVAQMDQDVDRTRTVLASRGRLSAGGGRW